MKLTVQFSSHHSAFQLRQMISTYSASSSGIQWRTWQSSLGLVLSDSLTRGQLVSPLHIIEL